MKMTFEQQLDYLLRYEDKHKLDELNINSFPVWFLVRLNLFVSIINQDKDLSFSDAKNKLTSSPSKVYLLKRAAMGLIRSVKQQLKHKPAKAMALTTLWSRRQKENGIYHDIFYDEAFDHGGFESLLFEMPLFVDHVHYTKNYKPERLMFGDWMLAQEFFIKKEDVQPVLKQVEQHYHTIYKACTGESLAEKLVSKRVANLISRYVPRLKTIRKTLQKIAPEVLITTSAYSPIQVIFCHFAHQMGIKVIEMQHGHITPVHLGYSYPQRWIESRAQLPIPDKILTFSPFYQQSLSRRGWPEKDLPVCGNPLLFDMHTDQIRNALKKERKEFEHIVMIVSQYTMTNQLIDFLKEATRYPDTLFVVKTHPRGLKEAAMYRNRIGHFSNIKVVTKGSIFDYLAGSDAAVGVYSSGLLDANQLGIPSFTYMKDENHQMAELAEAGLLGKVENLEQLMNIVKGLPSSPVEKEKVYSPYRPEALREEIEKLLKQ